MKPLTALLALAAAGLVAGIAVRLAAPGGSEPLIPEKPQPQVPGRLTSGLVGEGVDDGYYGECEFDALVIIRRDPTTHRFKVAQVLQQGDRPLVLPGDDVDTALLRETYVDSDRAEVYWGADGKLHDGCAPESMVYPSRGGRPMSAGEFAEDPDFYRGKEAPPPGWTPQR